MKIIFLNENSIEIDGEFILNKNPISIDCIVENEKINITGRDYFDCLSDLRKIFEKKNWLILCNGSRYDVFPSGMGRDMGLGKKAYQLKIGIKSKLEDLVDIFDYTNKDKIGTVEEQLEFYKQWLDSVKY